MPAKKLQPAIHPFDVLHGTDTSGLIPGKVIARGTSAKVEELTAYYGVAPSILQGFLDVWLQRTDPQPIEKTVFLDVGAGKGRAMLLASRFPFLRVEGVELNEHLAAIAQRNIELWHDDPLAQALAPLARMSQRWRSCFIRLSCRFFAASFAMSKARSRCIRGRSTSSTPTPSTDRCWTAIPPSRASGWAL
jgi:hypothetical protein